MHTKRTFFSVCCLVLIGFALFIFINQEHADQMTRKELAHHAEVIGRSLWHFDKGTPSVYLRLAAQSDDFASIRVYDDRGDVFLQVNGSAPDPVERILTRIGLIRRATLNTPIHHNGLAIGSLTAVWVNKTVYTYFYITVCLILGLLGVLLLLRLIEAKATLELRVKERTAELSKSESRFRTLVSNLPGAVYRRSSDASGTLEFISGTIETLSGRTPGELKGSTVESFLHMVHDDDRERVQKALESSMDNATPFALEYRLVTPDRHECWVYERGQRTIGVTDDTIDGVIMDISARKTSEQELDKLRHLLKNIIDSMPSVLVGVDTAGRVMQWNGEAERTTGITADEAIGRRIDEVFPLLTSEIESVKSAISVRMPQERLKVPLRVDGETHFHDITVYPLVANGVDGAVIRMDDVTSRVRIEEMMIQTEKMMSVGGLAAGMAHEINNPLGIILQSSQNVLRRVSPDMKRNVEAAEKVGITMEQLGDYMEARGIINFMESIRDAGTRAGTIVTNMLNFSRKSESRLAPHSINALLDKAATLASSDYNLKKKYDFKRISIVRDYDTTLPDIPLTETEIEQVFLNLLTNAAQAMSTKKMDEKPRIVMRTTRDNGWIRVEVEDNGPGIDELTRKRIFEPFFTTKKVGIGTGLGLSVSYFIITRNHGGKFSVDSEPGQWTKFIIHLPVIDE